MRTSESSQLKPGIVPITAQLRWWMLAFALLFSPAIVTAQDYVEWSTETRASVGFQVNAAAVAPLLPAGWALQESRDAPGRVNISVTFMDRHQVLDAQGQPIGSGTSRYMVVSVQARHESNGLSATMIVNGISPEGIGAYEVYQPAVVANVERATSAQAQEFGVSNETWEFAANSGDSVTLKMRYRQAMPVRRESSVVIRSGRKPEFTRTYVIDQATDSLGVPSIPESRVEQFAFTATGPLFSRIFDGTERITGVSSIPMYTREIFIP
jgi:hypothetical protein